jgi:hypothetical protein
MLFMTRSAASSSAQHRAVRQPSNVSQPAPARQAFQVGFASPDDEVAHLKNLLAQAEERKAEQDRIAAKAAAEETRKAKLAAAEQARKDAALKAVRQHLKVVGITGPALDEILAKVGNLRTDLVQDEEGDIPTDYEGTGMSDRLEQIMALVDKLGVITTHDITKHVLGKDGKEWKGNPVRKQLDKLVRRGDLVMGSCRIPRMSGRAIKHSPCYIWARNDQVIDAYKAQLANEQRNPKQ